jgi:hypothetical protein
VSLREPDHLPNLPPTGNSPDMLANYAPRCGVCSGTGKDAATGEHFGEMADCWNCNGTGDDPDEVPLRVILTQEEASHVLALLLQFSIAERRDTVSRQINQTAMAKLNGALS